MSEKILKNLNVYCEKCDSFFSMKTDEDEPLCPMCDAKVSVKGIAKTSSYAPAQAVAMFEHDSGEEIPVDKKGNIVHNAYTNDPRGWKRAGKSTKGYERSVIFK